MRLLKINSDNWEKACELTTNEDGLPTLYEGFVASNAYSLLQSIFEEGWNCRIIEEEGKYVGFTMFGFCKEDNFYEICRLMIDRNFQGIGYGRKALNLIIDEMKNMYSLKEVYLSAEPQNERAIHLYESCGFKATGAFTDGEKVLKKIL